MFLGFDIAYSSRFSASPLLDALYKWFGVQATQIYKNESLIINTSIFRSIQI